MGFSKVFRYDSYQAAMDRYRAVDKKLAQVSRAIAGGEDLYQAEFNRKEQCRLYDLRESYLAKLSARSREKDIKEHRVGFERTIGRSKDILSIEFFEEGLVAASPVGFISVNLGIEEGTGFLVGENILMTNHHVIPDKDTALDSNLELGKESNRIGTPKRTEQFLFEPDRFFFPNEELDFTLVAVKETSRDGFSLSEFGYHPLIETRGKIRIGDAVNIIQHPQGRHKSVVVHNSNLLHLEYGSELEPFLWYTSDTEPGSSGSPVFNNRWEVIGLHHRAVPATDENNKILSLAGKPMSDKRVDDRSEEIKWLANEGIRTSIIVKVLRETELEDEGMVELKEKLLELWSESKTGSRGLESARSARTRSTGVLVGHNQLVIKGIDASGTSTDVSQLNITLNLEPDESMK